MIRFRFAAAISSAVLGIALTSACALATDVDASSTTKDFVEFLTFVGAAPLAPADRDRVAAETQAQLRSKPGDVAKADQIVRHFLAALPTAKPWAKAENRETLRLQMEMLPPSDPIRQIVDRTDPVVVFDRAHKRLMTDGTLSAWRRACVWMAGVLSVPGPKPDFAANERAYLKANFASLPDAKADQVAHVERNYPVMELILEHADPAKRAEFIRQARPLALDEQQFGLRLAEAMSQSYDVAVHEELIQQMISHTAVLNGTAGYNHFEHVLWQRF